MEKKSPLVILQMFFGYKPGQTLKQFNEEIKALSDSEKRELAELAAGALGMEVDWSRTKPA